MNWTFLGTISPELYWQLFPISSINGQAIKITFGGLTSSDLTFSYILLRRKFPLGGDNVVTKAIAAYPQTNSLIIFNSLQQEFIDAGIVVYDWEVKLAFKRYSNTWTEPDYTVTLEEA